MDSPDLIPLQDEECRIPGLAARALSEVAWEDGATSGEVASLSARMGDSLGDRMSTLQRDPITGTVPVDILILPGFELHDLSSLLDAFQLSNALRHRHDFVMRVLGLSPDPVPSSIGVPVQPYLSVMAAVPSQNTIVLAGLEHSEAESGRLHHYLRKRHWAPGKLVAVGGGCRVLAEAGVLRTKQAAAHWELCSFLRELHRDTQFHDQLALRDGDVTTCSGRTATLDLALHCITEICGEMVTRDVADRFNCAGIRRQSRRQISSEDVALRRLPSSVQRAVEIIHQNIEDPVTSDKLAELSMACPRQLQRLFFKYFAMTPIRYYQQYRLRCARLLVRQSPLSVTEIALATGFKTSSHFTKCYKRLYGVKPSMDDRALWRRNSRR